MAKDRDEALLERLGYAQELRRRLGTFSSFAIGFSVISVLTGITSTFGEAFATGGPAGLGIGWPIVAAGTMVVALAMAELASAFPTAGALYHWASLLGGPAWGWATAMLNLVGQVAIVAAIDLACAQALAPLAGLPDGATPILFVVILLAHAAINAGSVRAVAWLNDASALVHVVGVAVLAALLFAARAHGPGYLATGAPTTQGFVQSLVLGVWTLTGFDAVAHVSEETHDPARRAPAGIVSAVGVSAIAGYALLAGLTLAVRDPATVAGRPDAALTVLRTAVGDGAGRAAMGLAVIAMWFAGLASVTSSSRMLYAFARDGGVPGAGWLRQVHLGTRTPVHAIAACTGAAGALMGATWLASDSVFLAVAALATVALYASYALPIALGAVARMRGRWKRRGRWHLGAAGVPLACVGVGWTAAVGVICDQANRTSTILFVVILGGLGALWWLHVRARFTGPAVDLAHFESRE